MTKRFCQTCPNQISRGKTWCDECNMKKLKADINYLEETYWSKEDGKRKKYKETKG